MKNLTVLTIAIVLGLISIMIVDLYSLKKEQTKHATIAVTQETTPQRLD